MTVAPIAGAVAGEAAAGGAAASGGASAAAGRAAGPAAASGATSRAGGGRRSAAGSRSKPRASKTGTPPATPAPAAAPESSASTGEQLRAAGANLGAGIADGARSLTLTPPKKLTASDGAGFLGGLLLYALFLNYLRYGQDGVKGWLAAKFVNRPWTPPDDGGGDGTTDGGRSA